MIMGVACSGNVKDKEPSKADTHSLYAPQRDSGLQPADSSTYHTDTSTQHTL